MSSPHRKAAYEANEYAIERIKEVVPIWKKEIWEDGEEWIGGQKKYPEKGSGAEMIKVNYFARLRELTGKAEETIEQESMTVRELLDWAEDTYPGFGKDTMHVAVNEEYALKEDVIQSGDICAFIPPVSGG